MYTEIISPRFAETDALGHINNTVVPVWFEQARKPVFQIFTPDLDPRKWRLIIAKIEVNFLAEIVYGYEAEIRTQVLSIGSTSIQLLQEVYQRGQLCAKGVAVLVHYDYQVKKSVPIPDDIRQCLKEHIVRS